MQNKLRCMLLVLLGLGGLYFALAAPDTVVAQTTELTKLEYTHTVRINGEESVARSTGQIDMATGTLIIEGVVEDYILGYRYWGTSWLTLKIISSTPVLALELDGALNLASLTNGELDYEIEVRTQDAFADIVTNINVSRNGETLIAELVSEGQAEYPDIVGMGEGPMVLFQTPLPTGEGFMERGVKQLISADGEIIESQIVAMYKGVKLPQPQRREVDVTVLSESDDRREVALKYETTVRPDNSTLFRGLRHAPAGNAKLEQRDQSLVVSNIGSSGRDGVNIDAVGGDFLLTTMGQMDPASLPTGAGVELVASGALGGEDNQPLVKMRVEDVGEEMHLSVDFSALEVISPTVAIFDADGNVLDRIVAGDDIIVRIPVPLDCIFDPIWPMWPDIWTLIDFPEPIQLAIGDGEFVEGSRVAFIAEDVQVDVGELSAVSITGRDMPSFTLLDEALGAFHRAHQALGDVQFNANRDQLVVSNIGSSGDDGVSIDADGEEALIVTLDQLTIPAGASASVAGFGEVDGKSAQPIATTLVESTGQAMEATFDFSAVGVEAYAVEIYRGDELVDRIDEITGIGAIILRPEGCTFDPVWPMGPDIWSIIDFPELAEITIPGRDPVRGDRIVAIAKDAPAEVGLLDEVTVQGEGFDSFTILAEAVPQTDVRFGGLRQHPQPNTVLTTEDGTLIAAPRDPNASFGVDVDPVGGDFLLTTMGQMDPATLPTGAWVELVARGVLDGKDAQPLVKMRVEDVGDEMHLSVDFSALGVISPTVAIFDEDGNVLDKIVAGDDIIVRIPVPLDCIFDPVWPMGPDIWTLIDFPEPIKLAIGDGEFAEGSRVAFIAEDAPVEVGELSMVSITGQGMPSFTILNQALGAFHRAHQALGQIDFNAVGDKLVVSNIGSSGDDGVSIDARGEEALIVTLDQLVIPEGASAMVAGVGEVDGKSAQPIANTLVESTGQAMEATFDFSAVGVETYTVEIYNGNELVDQADGITGIGAIILRPEGCTFDPVWPMGPDIWSIMDFPELAEITIPGRNSVRGAQDSVFGDRIVAIAKDAPMQVGLLDEVTVQGQGFDSFTILAEAIPDSDSALYLPIIEHVD